MRAVFSRKEPKIEAKEFCVEKVIMLPAGEYESFTNHLMHRHDFIRENVDFMYEKDGVRHCLLVTGEGMEEGVLVESEGSSYGQILCLCAIGKRHFGTGAGSEGNTDAVHDKGKRTGRAGRNGAFLRVCFSENDFN